jgi:hypothetical protein
MRCASRLQLANSAPKSTLSRSFATRGRVAQLGERLVRNEEAEGSNPFSSTKSSMFMRVLEDWQKIGLS